MGSLFIENLSSDPRYFFAVVITVVISITLHELAHGFMAVRRGDDTPYQTGHMTLNPLVHMGPFSLVMLAVAGIAWGAMPIDPTRLRGKYAEAMVALAGPATNFALAILAILGLGIWERFDPRSLDTSPAMVNAKNLLMVFSLYNVILGLFNLIPVPPLDGGHIASNLIPAYRNFLRNSEVSQGIMMAVFIGALLGAGRFIVPWAFQITSAALSAISGLPDWHFYWVMYPKALEG